MHLRFFGEISIQIFFRRDFSSDCFWQTLFLKDFLVEVFSEICLVGVSLQRMVEISLQRFSKAFAGIVLFILVEKISSEILCLNFFFTFFLAGKMFLEKRFGRGFSSQFFVR